MDLIYGTVTVHVRAQTPPPRLLPLGGEDAVEDGALPAVSHGLQDEHVLDDVEGEAVVGEGTQELGLQEGGPLLLQHPLAAFIALQTGQAC